MSTITAILLITSLFLTMNTKKEIRCEINNEKNEITKTVKQASTKQIIKEKEEENVQKKK